jgi:hypothetical protein
LDLINYKDEIENAVSVGSRVGSRYLLIGNGPLDAVGVDSKNRLWRCDRKEMPNGASILVHTMIADFSGGLIGGSGDIAIDAQERSRRGSLVNG